EECAEQFIREATAFYPKEQNVQKYKTLFDLYKKIYTHTKDLNTALKSFRKN
ncbi:xylulokinase, partial [Bacillus spizizenii]|nr:xylulokinase [Bacillus spizizenii]